MPTACFWVERSDRLATYLRIYDATDTNVRAKCPGRQADGIEWGYCWGRNRVEDIPLKFKEVDFGSGNLHQVYDVPPGSDYDDNPSWPTECSACGRSLGEAGMSRVIDHSPIYLYEGQEWPQRELPAGAMFDAHWWRELWRPFATDVNDRDPAKEYIDRGDGICLIVVLPNKAGEFFADRRSTQGGFWQRTGDPRNPPTLTVAPSILHTGSYHGFLQNGVLTDDLDGNPKR